MCFGNSPAPQAPQIQYVGPSEDDIRRNEQQLATFQQQLQTQQSDAAASIQQQIDLANQRTADIQADLDAEIASAQGDTSAAEAAAKEAQQKAIDAKKQAAAAAGASYTPFGAYGVTASQTEAPAAQTTKSISKKKKEKSTLKIAQNAAAATAGSGLNIGV